MEKLQSLAIASSAPPLASAPLSRFLRVPDPDLEAIHDGLWDLKQALALQCVFLAGCCHRARVAAGRMLPEGSRVAAPTTVTVGIIGGGTIGGVVAHALLDAGILPSAVLVSTRSPGRQKDLSARGVAVVFDNALVASKAQVLILAVLPAQLQEVARSMRPSANTLVLSLVGATPLPKVQQLFGTSHAVRSSADATLPLILAAQAELRADAGAAGVHESNLVAGRLADESVLELAAHGFAVDAASISRLLDGIRAVIAELELPPNVTSSLALEALFGEASSNSLAKIAAEIEAAAEPDAQGGGQTSDAVRRLRASFIQRISGAARPPEGERLDDFDDW